MLVGGAGRATYRPRGGERRFDDYDLTLAAAANGVGIALARDPLSRDAERVGAVVRLHTHELPADRGHYLVMRAGESRPAVLRVAERLVALCEPEPVEGARLPTIQASR